MSGVTTLADVTDFGGAEGYLAHVATPVLCDTAVVTAAIAAGAAVSAAACAVANAWANLGRRGGNNYGGDDVSLPSVDDADRPVSHLVETRIHMLHRGHSAR